MTLEPVHRLVTGVILSVAIPSPQFGWSAVLACLSLLILRHAVAMKFCHMGRIVTSFVNTELTPKSSDGTQREMF